MSPSAKKEGLAESEREEQLGAIQSCSMLSLQDEILRERYQVRMHVVDPDWKKKVESAVKRQLKSEIEPYLEELGLEGFI